MKYRKKPVVIEAVQWRGDNITEVMKLAGGGEYEDDFLATGDLTIKTLEGDMKASLNDWIIKGIRGELYPCKPDIFDATYEPVEETP